MIRVPSGWLARRELSYDGTTATMTFQVPTESASAVYRILSVSVGSASGRLTLCDNGCDTIVARELEELEASIDSAPGSWADEHSRDSRLDREPALLESPVARAGIAWPHCFPDSAYHVMALHDGRPVVLRFSRCVTPRDLIWRITDSFRFLR